MERTVVVWFGDIAIEEFEFEFPESLDEDEILEIAINYVYDNLYITVE